MRAGLVALLMWVGADLSATAAAVQETEEEAKGLVQSLAALVYTTAWPTATYQGLSLRDVRAEPGGYDVLLRLSGLSAFSGGELWMDIVLQLRHNRLHDVSVRRHNALLSAPFATAKAVAELVAAAANTTTAGQPRSIPLQPGPVRPEDRALARLLIGEWRDENTTFHYFADGTWEGVSDTGSRAAGVWGLRGDTLLWQFPNGRVNRYLVLRASTHEQVTKNLASGTIWTARRVTR